MLLRPHSWFGTPVGPEFALARIFRRLDSDDVAPAYQFPDVMLTKPVLANEIIQ